MTQRARLTVGEYIEALLVAILFALFVRSFFFQAFAVPSRSMEESLFVGDHIVVNKFIYGSQGPLAPYLPQRPVRRGDMVVFRFPLDPKRDYIKRCVALPGDTVQIIDKALQINGIVVDDASYTIHNDPRVYPRSHLLPERYGHRDNYGPYTVPTDQLFCLGDNRDFSHDSRFWGTVPASAVLGRAVIVYWSTSGEKRPLPQDGSWDRIRAVLTDLARLLRQTRWDRTFIVVR